MVRRRIDPERSERERRKDVPGLTSDSGPRARRVVGTGASEYKETERRDAVAVSPCYIIPSYFHSSSFTVNVAARATVFRLGPYQ